MTIEIPRDSVRAPTAHIEKAPEQTMPWLSRAVRVLCSGWTACAVLGAFAGFKYVQLENSLVEMENKAVDAVHFAFPEFLKQSKNCEDNFAQLERYSFSTYNSPGYYKSILDNEGCELDVREKVFDRLWVLAEETGNKDYHPMHKIAHETEASSFASYLIFHNTGMKLYKNPESISMALHNLVIFGGAHKKNSSTISSLSE